MTGSNPETLVRTAGRPVRCVMAGGSLVGLSAAIALSRLGMDVTVLERSPARPAEASGALLGCRAGASMPGRIRGLARHLR